MPNRGAMRVSGLERGPSVTISLNGAPVEAYQGEMLAAALLAAGVYKLRESPRVGHPRGAFCMMGVCQECLVRVGGRTQRACRVCVKDGLDVEFIPRIHEVG